MTLRTIKPAYKTFLKIASNYFSSLVCTDFLLSINFTKCGFMLCADQTFKYTCILIFRYFRYSLISLLTKLFLIFQTNLYHVPDCLCPLKIYILKSNPQYVSIQGWIFRQRLSRSGRQSSHEYPYHYHIHTTIKKAWKNIFGPLLPWKCYLLWTEPSTPNLQMPWS